MLGQSHHHVHMVIRASNDQSPAMQAADNAACVCEKIGPNLCCYGRAAFLCAEDYMDQ